MEREWTGNPRRLSEADRVEIERLVHLGEKYEEIGAAVRCSAKSIQRYMRETGGVRRRTKPRSPLRLSLKEREEISLGLERREPLRAIARRLSRSPSTISREVSRSGGRQGYRAWRADAAAVERGRRPKPCKLALEPELQREVKRGLELRWSPQQISSRLKWEHPGEARMQVSAETIYRTLFVQGRGALRRELASCLRSGRAQRRSRLRVARSGAGRLREMVLISERPAEVEDRAVPGHWEGDLLVGREARSAIGTLVERKTRFVILFPLPEGRSAEAMKKALMKAIRWLPKEMKRTLTWDQGKEMASHVEFSLATSMQVYFCDPHSPWQRGSSENTNGLLRQYFPKSADLSQHTAAQLKAVARELNGRPRQTLNWMTPSEALRMSVASTH
jgi:transposase, IS30 family